MADRMESQIAVTALDSAVARRGGNVAGCVLHTDRGSQIRTPANNYASPSSPGSNAPTTDVDAKQH
jgi:transposase InsO family protein